METGTIIGIVLTILIAVISSRSGKAKVTKPPRTDGDFSDVNPPTGSELPSFEDLWRQLSLPQDEPRHTPGESYVELDNPLESTRSYDDLPPYESAMSLETMRPPAMVVAPTAMEERRDKPFERAVSTIAGNADDDDDIDTAHAKRKLIREGLGEFDLRKAVIYSELLKPKYTEY